jgi:hypothetical protein
MLKQIFRFLHPAPAPKRPIRVEIHEAVMRYLDTRPYTLYADWDISKPHRKAKAADWLTDQIINVLEEMS